MPKILTLVLLLLPTVAFAGFRGHDWGTPRAEVKTLEDAITTKPIKLFKFDLSLPMKTNDLSYTEQTLTSKHKAEFVFRFDDQERLIEGEYRLSLVDRESSVYKAFQYFSSRLKSKHGDPAQTTSTATGSLGWVSTEKWGAENGYRYLKELWVTGDTVILHELSTDVFTTHTIQWLSGTAFDDLVCSRKRMSAIVEDGDFAPIIENCDSEEDKKMDELL